MKVLFILLICVMLAGCGDDSYVEEHQQTEQQTEQQINPDVFTDYSSLINNVNRSYLISKGGIQPTAKDILVLDIDPIDGNIGDSDYLEWLRIYNSTL